MAGPPSPTVAVDSDRTLLRRWRERDDLVARDMLLARYLPRARRVAAQYAYRQEPLDDLHQVASIGLMKALDRYDPDQGAALWTYALPTIVGELKRHFRDNCWTIRVPRPVQERAMTVQRAIRELTAQLGRSPTPREIAERTGLRREQLLAAMEAGSAHDPRSLDASIGDGDEQAGTVGDLIGFEDERLETAEQRVAIRPALSALPERERMILRLRFEEDLTQTEIAERVGISQMHVSRLLRRAIAAMRESLVAGGEPATAG
jgi:RNA polymerase sigma-B factor